MDSGESRFNKVGDPHQQEANKQQIWRPWLLNHKVIAASLLWVGREGGGDLCPFSVILLSKAQAEVTQKNGSCPQQPVSPAGPSHIQRAARDQLRAKGLLTLWARCVSTAGLMRVHCRAAHFTWDLQAAFDKVATCPMHLFPKW